MALFEVQADAGEFCLSMLSDVRYGFLSHSEKGYLTWGGGLFFAP
jgi:hypothetical protein